MRGTLICCSRVAKRLIVVLLRNIYTHRLCLRGGVQPSEAGRGETSPFKVLLLAPLCGQPFTLSSSPSATQGELREEATEQPSAAAPPPAPRVSSAERKQRWEAGQIDYMGDDSFDNIERKLNSFLK